MNAERLHVIAKAVRNEIANTSIESNLKQLVTNLQNLVNQPSHAPYQQNVSNIRTALFQALDHAASNDFPPTWRQALSELGANGLLGHDLRIKLEEIFSRNAITPSVALNEINTLLTTVSAIHTAFKQITEAFSQLSIGADDLEPGGCELGILIPRAFVRDNLAQFGDEILELNKILGVFSEISLGSRPDFKIRTLSSSDFTVFLDALPQLGACLAMAFEGIIDAYKKLLEIKKLKSELKVLGLSPENLKGVDSYASTQIDNEIEKIVPEILKQFYKKKDDGGRKHELTIELKKSLTEIAGRIDRGYNLEIRVKVDPATQNESDMAEHIVRIQESFKTLQFMKQEGEPILSLPETREVQPKKPHDKKKHDE